MVAIQAQRGETFVRTLRRLVELADKRLWAFRNARKRYVREYAGTYYGAGKRVPLNKVYEAVRATVPELLYREKVKSMVRGENSSIQVDAMGTQLALDELFEQIGLLDTLRRVILDAMFGLGVVKTGVALTTGPHIGDNDLQPFCDIVDMDDYVIDTQARVRSEAQFEGNFYFVPQAWALESGMYNREALQKVQTYTGVGGTYSENEERTTRNLSRENVQKTETESLSPRYRLFDVWLPAEKVILTIPGLRGGPDVILRETAWEGPERGMYDTLSFLDVPGNVLPVPPVSEYFDLHEAINLQARKAMNEADKHKKVVAYDQAAAQEDADKIRKANDGEFVGVMNVDRMKELEIGAPAKGRYETLNWLEMCFKTAAGNPGLFAGIAAQSGTNAQDQLLQQNAQNGWIGDMRSCVRRFGNSVAGKLAWYLWHMTVSPTTYEVREPGLPKQKYTFAGASGDGNLGRMRIEVDLYSSLSDDPRQRFQRLMGVVQFMATIAPMVASTGYVFNAPGITEQAAKMLDAPELAGLWVPAAPVMTPGIDQQGGGPSAPPDQGGGQGQQQAQPQEQPEPAGATA